MLEKRKILFRGRDQVSKAWRYGGLENNNWIWGIETETLTQYTGLKDCEGKRIFEGDIVNVRWDKWHFTAEVQHDIVNPCFVLVDIKDPNNTEYDFSKAGMMRLKIIGNIFDNTELLEDK